MSNSHWQGKKVAFLGDSITDKQNIGTAKVYWKFLQESMGIEPYVYGRNGHQWTGIYTQAQTMAEEIGDDIDAISIFAGTNDFNASLPLGEWWEIVEEEVNNRCKIMVSPRRRFIMDEGTFRGRINIVMSFLKQRFPEQQIFLMTPIHRGYATFGPTNVQPEESFPNQIGLYVDQYIDVIKEAGNLWAVPVLDLNAMSGLYPLAESHGRYFNNSERDRLHPRMEGHRRMALVIEHYLNAMPATFKL